MYKASRNLEDPVAIRSQMIQQNLNHEVLTVLLSFSF